MKLVQFIKLYMNIKNWTKIETNVIFFGMIMISCYIMLHN